MSLVALRGQLDKIVAGAPIFGWAVVLDAQTGTKRVRNRIRVSNSSDFTTEFIADITRLDVAAILECDPQCGFIFTPPDELVARGNTTLTFTVEPEGLELKHSPLPLNKIDIVEVGNSEEALSIVWANVRHLPDESDLKNEQKADNDDKILFIAAPREKIFGPSPEVSALKKRLGFASVGINEKASSHSAIDAVSEHFDRTFYLQVYSDVDDSGMDPLNHYKQIGWRERRRPSAWFDTGYYLEANPDVLEAAIDPFWHYLVVGRDEGRRSRRVGGRRREVVENLKKPEDKTSSYVRLKSLRKMIPSVLLERLYSASNQSGLAVAIGHDSYLKTAGGIQIFTADEQRAFKSRRVSYLHLSPVDPDLVLVKSKARAFYQVSFDGEQVGIFSHEDIIDVLSNLREDNFAERIFIVHSLLGHNIDRLIKLKEKLSSSQNYFWIHDYTSICVGFNLLRNDVEFCHAPRLDSLSCQICIYGQSRPTHLTEIHTLFDAVSFTVLAPSKAALGIWTEGTQLPHKNAYVHEHCKFEPNAVRTEEPSLELKGEPENPVRVAFIGYPSTHKGWYIFENLLDAVSHMKCYRFFHFLSSSDTQNQHGQVTRIATQTSATHRDAMIDAIASHDIDIVLVLSPWPETFSYVTYEAFAAGADVIALADSGNVAAAIVENRMGIVVQDEEILLALFTSLRIVTYVRYRKDNNPVAGSLAHSGTTATFWAPGK